jgi:uncharacterized protein (TIGR02302 family)
MKLAGLALAWERAWPLAWPLPSLAALFAAVALLDVLPMLPGWLHAAILAAFAAGFVAVLFRLRRFRWPSLAEERRRLETDNDLPHRPLQALADTLAAGADDPLSKALWDINRLRLAKLLTGLAVRLPLSDLPRRDPLGLRFAPFLLLAIALAAARHDPGERLLRALEPDLASLGSAPALLQVWITPPDYTGIAPILLDGTSGHLVVSAGSKLLAELQGGHGTGQLFVDDHGQRFQALDADSQRLETTITGGRRLTVRQGRRPIGSWTIEVAQATPPTIAFASPPEADSSGRLRLDIEAHDAYGVAKAWAAIRRADNPGLPPLTVGLPIGGGHPPSVRQAAWHDLTSHPWAGLPVTIQPTAENTAGLAATGAPVAVTLPERHFTDPVARAIIEQRRALSAAPDRRRPVVDGLAAIASAPGAFHDDLVVFLALATARARLLRDQSADAVPSVLALLWETALRIEDGDRPAAERTLDEATHELQQALSKGASEAELDRLTKQLQAAMEQYLQALRRLAERRGQPLDDLDRRVITEQELKDMIDRMHDMARTGSRQAAQEMLDELRQMLDQLRAGMPNGQSEAAAGQARQALDALQDIANGQRQLLDETFRRSQELPDDSALSAPGGRQGKAQGGKQQGSARAPDDPAAGRQEDLRSRLDQLMQSLGQFGVPIAESLGQAEQAMRSSTQSLRRGDLPAAVDAQTEAVARLQDGARQAEQAMGGKNGPSGGRQGAGNGRDPLGRQTHGWSGSDESAVKIPTVSDVQKAREVLDELRKRSGEAARPPAERDYLQRLLRQFF